MTTSKSTACSMATAAPWRMANDNDEGTGLAKRFGDLTFYLVSIGTVALIGTSIRVWAGMDVIQTQIGALVKSDASQDQRIERLVSDINTLRVQVGVIRATQSINGIGRP